MIQLLVLALAAAYWLGYRGRVRLLGRRGWGSAEWRALLFYLGLGVLLAVESGPLMRLGAHYFVVRTSQLMAIVMVAAPLLVLGSPRSRLRPLVPGLAARAFSLRLRGRRARWAVAGGAFALFNGALWAWHLSPLYDLAAGNAGASSAVDVGFAAVGFLFWTQVIDDGQDRPVMSYLQRVVYLIVASTLVRILALILGFSHAPFYPHYVHLLGAPGALFDQQLGAGVMLVPGILSDTIALTVCLFLWLAEEDHRGRSRHGRGPGTREALPAAVGWYREG